MDSSAVIARLAQEVLDDLLGSEPLEATLIGFREYDPELADLSPEADARHEAERGRIRSSAEAIDPTTLDAQDALTRAVIIAQCDLADESDAVDAVDFTVSSFPVCPSSVLLSYLRMVVATNPQEAEDYLLRLTRIPRYLGQASERLARGRVAGLTPVAHLVEQAIEQIERFLSSDQSALVIEPPQGWPGAPEWSQRLLDVIEAEVKPAFRAYADDLATSALPTARPAEHPGLVHLPGGVERYRRLVRVHTTTDRTPEELHDAGLRIMESIHEEFQALGSEVFGLTDVPAIFDRLQTDPSLRWHSSEQILAAAESTVRRAEAAAPQWFARVPRAVCALEAIPELEAEGAAPAYYLGPSLDGARPGTYFANVNKPEQRTSFDLESVAFHEAVPGHHFQISLALELEGLPTIRRLALFTAYVEGWGLYSERLADEMGLYSSPVQRMGMLSADAWRAARLVVDTGIHAFGWSRQQAVDYMLQNTAVAPIDVESEIDRYIAYPGQALSYMTGRLEILRLREHAERELGDNFDIADFHEVVLSNGALPLSVLADVVEDWVESR